MTDFYEKNADLYNIVWSTLATLSNKTEDRRNPLFKLVVLDKSLMAVTTHNSHTWPIKLFWESLDLCGALNLH